MAEEEGEEGCQRQVDNDSIQGGGAPEQLELAVQDSDHFNLLNPEVQNQDAGGPGSEVEEADRENVLCDGGGELEGNLE